MLSFDTFLEQTVLGNKVENLLWFFGILIIGLPFLRQVSKIFNRLFYRLFKRFSAEIRAEKFIELLLRPVQSLLLILLLYIAINRLDYPLHEVFFKRKDIEVHYIDIIDKLFLFSFLLIFFWVLTRIVDYISLVLAYKASLTESKSDDQLVPFVKELAKIIVGIAGLFVLLGLVFEVNVLTLITGLGIGGVAIALAAKQSLEDLLASFVIFFDKPFVVGDLIRIDNIEGTVEKVGFRSSHIKTGDKSVISIPNRKMIDSYLENLTLRDFRREKFSLGLTYDTSPETLRTIIGEINQMISSQKHCKPDGPVIFKEFGDSALILRLQYYIDMMDHNAYLKVKEEVNFKILDIVYKNGASLAFPTRTIIHSYADSPKTGPETKH